MRAFGEAAKPLEFDTEAGDEQAEAEASAEKEQEGEKEKEAEKTLPPKEDEFLWAWKVRYVIFLQLCGY